MVMRQPQRCSNNHQWAFCIVLNRKRFNAASIIIHCIAKQNKREGKISRNCNRSKERFFQSIQIRINNYKDSREQVKLSTRNLHGANVVDQGSQKSKAKLKRKRRKRKEKMGEGKAKITEARW